MSKRKHNIAYIKPDEPKFLREMKIQAGYKEGPTIDTKVMSQTLLYNCSTLRVYQCIDNAHDVQSATLAEFRQQSFDIYRIFSQLRR